MAESPTFAQCRAAARAARAADLGRQAYNTVRPRGVAGFRARGPLSLMLYVAGCEGRLVWLDAQTFALLEPPLVARRQRGGGTRLGLLRLADRHWDLLLSWMPPILAMLIAVMCALWRPLWIVALLLALAIPMYAGVLMVSTLVVGAVSLYRTLGRHDRLNEDSTESSLAHHWSLRLWHCGDAQLTDDLLSRTLQILRRLAEVRGSAAALEHGAVTKDSGSAAILVVVTRGVTTSAARQRLAQTDRVRPYGADILLVLPTDRIAEPEERPVRTAKFFFWYLIAAAFVIAVCAWIVADSESSLCADDCAGRPATYESALRWLLGAADHLQPATTGAWVIGVTTTMMRWMTLLLFIVAIRLHWRVMAHERKRFAAEVNQVMARPRVAVFVVTSVELEALTDAAARVRPGGPFRPEHRKTHSAFSLGEFGGCDVLAVRSGPGPTSPIGLMHTVDAVIRDMSPEFLILTGICYGLKDSEQHLGDIVIASQVRDTDHRKLAEDDRGVIEQPRGDRRGPRPTMYHHVVAAARARTDVHIGPMVASGTLLNSETRRAELIALNPDAIAGDMESHVFSGVAAAHGAQWCVVRGISDWGMKKSDGHQRIAAENAATFVLEVIGSGALAQLVLPR